jgi:hypothetical protein
MFTDDIHPEELLVATRALTPNERADLRAHTARCPACALQLALRDDVASALTPNEGDYQIAGRALARALAAAPSRAPAPVVRRRAPMALRTAAVLAVMLGTGVAASAIVMSTHGRLWGVAPKTEESARPAATRGHAARPTAERPAVLVAPPIAPAVLAAPPVAPPPAAPSSPALHPAHTRVAMRAHDGALARAMTPPALPAAAPEPSPAEPAAAPAAEAPQPERASEVFAAAARARREGDSTRAEGLYAHLAATFPGTREEMLARVLRGQTLLDNLGRPGDALAAFDAYLRDQPNGALAEQARAGRAQALWLLGRPAEEAAAWRDLLALHPRSLHAALARSRLAALSHAGE